MDGNHLTTRRAGRGVTLIDAVISLLIISILAGIAVPQYANALAGHRLEAAATRIVADLSLARREAQMTGTEQTVEFQPGDGHYHLMGLRHLDRAGEKYMVSLSQEPYRTTIVSAEFGGDAEIVFDGYGVPDTGGTITIQAGARKKTINIDSATAQVDVQDS